MILVLVLGLIFLMSFYVNASQKRIFEASSVSLEELYSNIKDGFISHTEKQWNMLETVRPLL